MHANLRVTVGIGSFMVVALSVTASDCVFLHVRVSVSVYMDVHVSLWQCLSVYVSASAFDQVFR